MARLCQRLDFGEHPTTLAAALLHCPDAHPFWSWWMVSLVHLRLIEGLPPAHLAAPEMTHEIAVQAINPERCPVPDPAACREGYPHLTPPDIVQQFAAQSDAMAVALFAWLCDEVQTGKLSPDQDHRACWKAACASWLARRASAS